MRKRATAIAGVACGLACAACVWMFLQDAEARAQEARAEALARYGGEQLEVCTAKRDIAAGEIVGAADVEMKLWVADLLPAEAVRTTDEVVGRQAASSILQGEALSLKRFRQAAQALEVPSGMAAVSVPARDVQAVGGALRSGMKVDVYSTGQTSTKRILAGALVVSTNGATFGDEAEGDALSWVTLAVGPESVQEVVAAAQSTDLYFTLPGDGAGEGGSEELDVQNESGSQSGSGGAVVSEGADAA